MALPLQLGKKGAGRMCTLRVLRRFEFDPAVMRSAVLAVDCEDPDRGMFFMRGAPSVVEQLARGGQVPSDYRQASFVIGSSLSHSCPACVNRDQALRFSIDLFLSAIMQPMNFCSGLPSLCCRYMLCKGTQVDCRETETWHFWPFAEREAQGVSRLAWSIKLFPTVHLLTGPVFLPSFF